MRQITKFTNSPNQDLYYVTDESKEVKIHLFFLPTQSSWFMDIETDNFQLYGTRVCCHPNLLNKYHNIIDFGISIRTKNGYDPFTVEDFTNGFAGFYILDKSEVAQLEDYFNGTVKA